MGLPTQGQGLLSQDKLIISTYLPTALSKADLEQKQRKKALQMVPPLGSPQQGWVPSDPCRLSPESSSTGTAEQVRWGQQMAENMVRINTHSFCACLRPRINRRGIWPQHLWWNHGHSALRPLMASTSYTSSARAEYCTLNSVLLCLCGLKKALHILPEQVREHSGVMRAPGGTVVLQTLNYAQGNLTTTESALTAH